jgi:hypothetical protein
MGKIKKDECLPAVDKDLIALFLKMSPEERLKANDNAMRGILELRDGFEKRHED